jgi:hypothetical protein
VNEATPGADGRPDLDREIDRIDQGGDAWLESDEVVAVEVKRPLDKVIPVRLSADKWEALREEARELGVGPSTLVRMWVLEKLRQARRTASVS